MYETNIACTRKRIDILYNINYYDNNEYNVNIAVYNKHLILIVNTIILLPVKRAVE